MNEMRKLMEAIEAIAESSDDAYKVGYKAGLRSTVSAFQSYKQWCGGNPGVACKEAAAEFVRGYNDGKQFNMDNTQSILRDDVRVDEAFRGQTYDAILDSGESKEEAMEYAQGMVWDEVETTDNYIKYANHIGSVNDIDVYYDYGADYYFFVPASEGIHESQTANPRDTVHLDIPLLIRLLEFAREDAKTDQDLHSLTDNMINLSPDGDMLTMADYAELVTGLAGNKEDDIAYDPQPGDDEPLKHGWQA